MAQEKGRSEILLDYHLRVGQVTRDTRIPEGYTLQEQRLDETEVGDATTIILIDAKRPARWAETTNAADCSGYLGLNGNASGMIGWDVFDAVLTPGDLILLASWRTQADAETFENAVNLPEGATLARRFSGWHDHRRKRHNTILRCRAQRAAHDGRLKDGPVSQTGDRNRRFRQAEGRSAILREGPLPCVQANGAERTRPHVIGWKTASGPETQLIYVLTLGFAIFF
jgi:hypothetical protein